MNFKVSLQKVGNGLPFGLLKPDRFPIILKAGEDEGSDDFIDLLLLDEFLGSEVNDENVIKGSGNSKSSENENNKPEEGDADGDTGNGRNNPKGSSGRKRGPKPGSKRKPKTKAGSKNLDLSSDDDSYFVELDKLVEDAKKDESEKKAKRAAKAKTSRIIPKIADDSFSDSDDYEETSLLKPKKNVSKAVLKDKASAKGKTDVNYSGSDSGDTPERTAAQKLLLKKQAQKSRIKGKVTASIKSFRKLSQVGPPLYLAKMIKNKEFTFNRMSASDSIECYEFFRKHNKDEIALCLLACAKDADQLNFVKRIVMKEDFFKILFANIIPI